MPTALCTWGTSPEPTCRPTFTCGTAAEGNGHRLHLCVTILNTTLQLQAALAVLMEPILPFSAERLWRMLNGAGSHRDVRWSDIPSIRLSDDRPLGKREILPSKIEDDIIEAQVARLGK